MPDLVAELDFECKEVKQRFEPTAITTTGSGGTSERLA
jgi:hypothetical protein